MYVFLIASKFCHVDPVQHHSTFLVQLSSSTIRRLGRDAHAATAGRFAVRLSLVQAIDSSFMGVPAKVDTGRSEATRKRDYELRWLVWVNARRRFRIDSPLRLIWLRIPATYQGGSWTLYSASASPNFRSTARFQSRRGMPFVRFFTPASFCIFKSSRAPRLAPAL